MAVSLPSRRFLLLNSIKINWEGKSCDNALFLSFSFSSLIRQLYHSNFSKT